MPYLSVIPSWAWIFLVTTLTVGSLVAVIKKPSPARIVLFACSVVITVGVFFVHWQMYLDNHFIGGFDENGLPSHISESGWHLIVASWPLWLPLCAGTILLLSSLITLYHSQNKGMETQSPLTMLHPKDPVDDSRTLIQLRLENETFRRQLAISQEKCKILEKRTPAQASKNTRTTLNIRQLREKLIQCKRSQTSLKKEVETLKSDLERSHQLVDQLLEEKYHIDKKN